MLVLSRKKNESIVINNDITIVVVEIRGTDKVRLGVEAPKEVPVHRREVYEAIRSEANADQRRAASREAASNCRRERIRFRSLIEIQAA